MLLFSYKNIIIQRKLQIKDDNKNKKKSNQKLSLQIRISLNYAQNWRIIVLYLAKPCIIYGDLDLGTLYKTAERSPYKLNLNVCLSIIKHPWIIIKTIIIL